MKVDVFCADASVAVGEPLFGTAAETSHWLVLEHSGAWGPKGVDDSGLNDALVSYLKQLGELAHGLRVQLIRRGEGRETLGRALKLFLSSAEQGEAKLYELSLTTPSELLRLGLEAWLSSGTLPAGAAPSVAPLYLVCVHGKRDRCCALKGLPFYNALRERVGERVFQTTHLGGHRFAATAVVLPDAICYGRLQASDAQGLKEAHDRREFYRLDLVRGRTSQAQAVQAAEVLVRQQLSELRLSALKLVSASKEGDATRVRFLHLDSGAEHAVELTRSMFPPAPGSCGAEPQPVKGLVQLGPKP